MTGLPNGAPAPLIQTTDFTDFQGRSRARGAHPWKSVKSVVPNSGACGALPRL